MIVSVVVERVHVALVTAALPRVVLLPIVTGLPKLDVALTVRVSSAASPSTVLLFAVNAPVTVAAPVTAKSTAVVPVGRCAESVDSVTFLAVDEPDVAISNSSAGSGAVVAVCPEMNVASGVASTTWLVSAEAERTEPSAKV